LRSAIGFRICDNDSCDGRLGGEDNRRFDLFLGEGVTGARPLGWLESGGIDGLFFLEEFEIIFGEEDLAFVEKDGYSF